jgi:hypothetical protein
MLEVNTFQMCKACDDDIVRALETQPKALPWKDEIEFRVVAGFVV